MFTDPFFCHSNLFSFYKVAAVVVPLAYRKLSRKSVLLLGIVMCGATFLSMIPKLPSVLSIVFGNFVVFLFINFFTNLLYEKLRV